MCLQYNINTATAPIPMQDYFSPLCIIGRYPSMRTENAAIIRLCEQRKGVNYKRQRPRGQWDTAGGKGSHYSA